MPSSNGVYSLPPGYLAVTGSTILASQHNPIFEDVAAALTLRLSRDGSAPMTGPINLATGTATAPSLIFTGNVGTGVYPTAAGIGFSVQGSKVAEITAAGIASGVWMPGMLIPWTMSAAPNALWVFPVGQTLSRVAFPLMWTQVQLEITAGNTFYNNGDGSTTFGIGDLRGRIPVAADNMGGTQAFRINNILANALGSTGGEQLHTLTAGEIPLIQSGGSIGVSAGGLVIPTTGVFTGQIFVPGGGSGANPIAPTGSSPWTSITSMSGSASNWLSNNTGGGAHNNVQPSIVTNYLLYVGN